MNYIQQLFHSSILLNDIAANLYSFLSHIFKRKYYFILYDYNSSPVHIEAVLAYTEDAARTELFNLTKTTLKNIPYSYIRKV